MDPSSDLTPYELMVKKNIEHNREVLRSLGLVDTVAVFQKENKVEKPRKSAPQSKYRCKASQETPKTETQLIYHTPRIRTRRSSSILKSQGGDEFQEFPNGSCNEENTPPHLKKKAVREQVFGEIEGVSVGEMWLTRMECSAAGVHRPTVAGIHGKLGEGCYSIALSGGYEDDVDYGDFFTYTGSGGRDLKGTKSNPKNLRTAPQSKDQVLDGANAALALNIESKKPVRVIRGYKLQSPYAPDEGYRYDGLYSVEKYWTATGLSGFKVYKFALKRLPNQDPPAWKTCPFVSPEKPAENKLDSSNEHLQNSFNDFENKTAISDHNGLPHNNENFEDNQANANDILGDSDSQVAFTRNSSNDIEQTPMIMVANLPKSSKKSELIKQSEDITNGNKLECLDLSPNHVLSRSRRFSNFKSSRKQAVEEEKLFVNSSHLPVKNDQWASDSSNVIGNKVETLNSSNQVISTRRRQLVNLIPSCKEIVNEVSKSYELQNFSKKNGENITDNKVNTCNSSTNTITSRRTRQSNSKWSLEKTDEEESNVNIKPPNPSDKNEPSLSCKITIKDENFDTLKPLQSQTPSPKNRRSSSLKLNLRETSGQNSNSSANIPNFSETNKSPENDQIIVIDKNINTSDKIDTAHITTTRNTRSCNLKLIHQEINYKQSSERNALPKNYEKNNIGSKINTINHSHVTPTQNSRSGSVKLNHKETSEQDFNNCNKTPSSSEKKVRFSTEVYCTDEKGNGSLKPIVDYNVKDRAFEPVNLFVNETKECIIISCEDISSEIYNTKTDCDSKTNNTETKRQTSILKYFGPVKKPTETLPPKNTVNPKSLRGNRISSFSLTSVNLESSLKNNNSSISKKNTSSSLPQKRKRVPTAVENCNEESNDELRLDSMKKTRFNSNTSPVTSCYVDVIRLEDSFLGWDDKDKASYGFNEEDKIVAQDKSDYMKKMCETVCASQWSLKWIDPNVKNYFCGWDLSKENLNASS